MKFYFDTEFHEYHKKSIFGTITPTIDLISIGIVSDSGHEYYGLNKDCDLNAAWGNTWLRENVFRPIYNAFYKKRSEKDIFEFDLWSIKILFKEHGKSRKELAQQIKEFVWVSSGINDPECINNWDEVKHKFPVDFYAYFADYDWVVMCQLFGRMINLPKGFPMYCNDLKQTMDEFAGTKGSAITKAVNEVFAFKGPAYQATTEWGSRSQNVKILKEHPEYPQNEKEHDALADAKWNLELDKFLIDKM